MPFFGQNWKCFFIRSMITRIIILVLEFASFCLLFRVEYPDYTGAEMLRFIITRWWVSQGMLFILTVLSFALTYIFQDNQNFVNIIDVVALGCIILVYICMIPDFSQFEGNKWGEYYSHWIIYIMIAMFLVEFVNGAISLAPSSFRDGSSRGTFSLLSTSQSDYVSSEQRELASRESSHSRKTSSLRTNSSSRPIDTTVRFNKKAEKVALPNSSTDVHSDLIRRVGYFLRHGSEYQAQNRSQSEGIETSPSMTTFMGSACGLNRERGRFALTDSDSSIEGNILTGQICICEYIKLVKQRISANRDSSRDSISTTCHGDNGESRHLLTVLHKEVTSDHENVVVATAIYKDSKDVCAKIVITLKDDTKVADEASGPLTGSEGSIFQSLLPSVTIENSDKYICDTIAEDCDEVEPFTMEENEPRRSERTLAWQRAHIPQEEIAFIDTIEEDDENITTDARDEVEERRREESVRPKRKD